MSSTKLDYNGLQTLIQNIKFYISQVLSDYLPLSGGTMSGEIKQYSFNTTKAGIKGMVPEETIYCTAFIARDTSNNISHSSEGNKHRYALFESQVDTNGTCHSYMRAYKNETDSEASTTLTVSYPMSGDPYIQVTNHIKLASGVEIY